MSEVPLAVGGLPGRLVRRAAPGVLSALGGRGEIVDRARRLGNDATLALTKRYSFGSRVPASYVQWTAEMIAATPIDVIAKFFPDFDAHDRRDALAALREIETLIVVGREDKVTPVAHSKQIADALPKARLDVLPDCGHMLLFEHHAAVSGRLRALIDRAAGTLA
jgi:pimeloyl-ACP methyl ester carboxylesterase